MVGRQEHLAGVAARSAEAVVAIAVFALVVFLVDGLVANRLMLSVTSSGSARQVGHTG